MRAERDEHQIRVAWRDGEEPREVLFKTKREWRAKLLLAELEGRTGKRPAN